MGTPASVIAKALGEVGYYAPDDPQPGSKYGRYCAEVMDLPWLAGPSRIVWWCVMYGSWVYAGEAEVPGLPGYNTDQVLAAARAAGALVPKEQAQPGDALILDWNPPAPPTNHFAVLRFPFADHAQTIEGNTSGTDGAHQSDGNGVWQRTRSWDNIVGIIRPRYIEAPVITVSQPAPPPVHQPEPAPPRTEQSPDSRWHPWKRWYENGDYGYPEVGELQRVLNRWYPGLPRLAEDDDYGPKTTNRVIYTQSKARGASGAVDGKAGDITLHYLGIR